MARARGQKTEDPALDGALDAIGAAIDGASDAPSFAAEGDMRPFGGQDDDDDIDAPALPPGCPVQPLGVNGQSCWYLDVNGQLISLAAGNGHGKNAMVALFGRKIGWLEAQIEFAQWSKPVREREEGTNRWVIVQESEIIGFDQAKASKALIVACTRRGIFDPAGHVRGAGAHRSEDGGLILHCGNHILRQPLRLNGAAGEPSWHYPGLHGEHVYTAAAPIPRPWPEGVGEDAAAQALALLKQWYWRRPQLDPLLVLGAIGVGLVGGALEWRSNVWITGGAGSGKSSLNGKRGVLDQIFGRGAVRAADVTGAYLRQRLKNATLPVFLDELEAESDDRRSKQILELARISSSGDDAGRGGSDHQAAEFTLQSAFWASSILIPPMKPQDRSRWAICQLMPIPIGAKKPDLKAQRLPELGQKLLRRMVDGWARWDATLEAYVDALGAIGHSARACMQFGTLLAAADLLQNDGLPDLETIDMVASLCGKDMLREVAETAPEHELCLNHLRTSMVQSRGGDERESIGTWIGGAVHELCEPGDSTLVAKYHRRLQDHGLKIVCRTATGTTIWKPGERGFLAIADTHQALAGLFSATEWKSGVWKQALGYTPGSQSVGAVKFRHHSARATLVPLETVIDAAEIPAKARWEGLALGNGEGGE